MAGGIGRTFLRLQPEPILFYDRVRIMDPDHFFTPKKFQFTVPVSPENVKLNTSLSNAPSPRTLPRSLSRTSNDEDRRLGGNSQEGLVKVKKLLIQRTSSSEGRKAPSKPVDWEWEYAQEQVGAYDIDSRRARIEKYREKRKSLTFRKVRYSARSNICQKRERVGGRFVKTNQIIRADSQALMHPDTVQRPAKQPKRAAETTDLETVAELMIGLSKSMS